MQKIKSNCAFRVASHIRGGMVGEADAYLLPQTCTTFLGASPSEMGEEGPRCPALWGAAGTHVTVDAACQARMGTDPPFEQFW